MNKKDKRDVALMVKAIQDIQAKYMEKLMRYSELKMENSINITQEFTSDLRQITTELQNKFGIEFPISNDDINNY